MKGYKTIIFNALIVGFTAMLQFAVDINWKDIVSPEMALIIVSILNIGLRFITTTPIGKKEIK